MTRASVVVLAVFVLAVFALALVALDITRPVRLCGLDYPTLAELLFVLAELLLVYVVIAEGSVAIKELELTREQLRFDALARIHDYIREVQSLGFQEPVIWREWNSPLEEFSEKEQWAITAYIRLSMNSFLLQWEANNRLLREDGDHQPDKDQLTKDQDFKYFIRRRRTMEFWSTHKKFYPTPFQDWVDQMLKASEGPATD